MNSIQIKNLRSLRDTGEIQMKKLNVLVGSNSSGKSTFLRIFPLLKQSFNKRINGPVLWCGDDDDYVDFGSFQEALNYHADDKNNSIRIVFDFFADFRFNTITRGTVFREKMSGDIQIEFAISHSPKTTYDYVSELTLNYENYLLTAEISDKHQITSLRLNNEKIALTKQSEDFYDYEYDEGIFNISFLSVSQTAKKNIKEILDLGEEYHKIFSNSYIPFLADAINNHKHSRKPVDNAIYEKVAYEKEHHPDKITELKKWLYLCNLPKFFELISEYLINYFVNVYYIAPVRATAERYYKLRNLAVDEVDCRGKNLPIFLNSLRDSSFFSFQAWTLEHLGFKVYTSVSEGHVSLKIQKEGQATAVNLSDTGFGYSQILPIVTQLWYIAAGINEKRSIRARNAIRNIPKTIVIEQPELHLHPALQAKLMDIIVKIAAEGNIHFIIETHSETMINRIGALIEKQKIKNEDVGIIIFNKQFDDDETRISKSSFDEEGYLENWPIGFFEPEEE